VERQGAQVFAVPAEVLAELAGLLGVADGKGPLGGDIRPEGLQKRLGQLSNVLVGANKVQSHGPALIQHLLDGFR
jgi:hypothetical protein